MNSWYKVIQVSRLKVIREPVRLGSNINFKGHNNQEIQGAVIYDLKANINTGIWWVPFEITNLFNQNRWLVVLYNNLY